MFKCVFNFKISFYPIFGYCWEISDYKIQNEMMVTGDWTFTYYVQGRANYNEERKGYFLFSWNWKLSFFDPYQPDYCGNYELDEHEECVDENLKDYNNDNMKCTLPWLAKKNACLDMKWFRNKNISNLLQLSASAKNTLTKTGKSIINMENFDAKKACPVPCSLTRSNIRYGSKWQTLSGAEVRSVRGEDYIF